jgi:dihydroorotate dehydrogenase
MKVSLAGLELVNPVIAASGTFGYGIEFEEIVSLERIGGFVTKGISLEPMAGHAAPRIVQTAAGMLNAIGLQNVGVEEYHRPQAAAAEPLSRLQGHRQRLRLHGGRVHRGHRAAQPGRGHRGL